MLEFKDDLENPRFIDVFRDGKYTGSIQKKLKVYFTANGIRVKDCVTSSELREIADFMETLEDA